MKVFQDEYGRPIQANFAVIDTIKWEDLPQLPQQPDDAL